MIEKYLNNRLFTLLIFPFFLGSITVFSFQPYNLTIINFIVLPLIFYLIIFISKKSKNIYRKKPFRKNLFYCGTSFGYGFYLSGLHWITHSLTFDENFKVLVPFAIILIPLFLSFFFSITILLVGPYLKMNLASIFLFSSSLAFSDWVRATILTGFPWNLWAYSFSWATEVIQVLHIVGLFAFNLIIITIFLTPALLLFNSKLSQKFISISILFIFLICLFIYGNFTINKNKDIVESATQKFNVKVISPNFELRYGINLKEIQLRLNKLIRYSDPVKNTKTLFIWPEGVFSGYNYSELLPLKEIFMNNFDQNHFILFGVNRLNKKNKGIYNSLIVVNSKMEILQEYKKQKLVPFGEFLPFEKHLNKIGIKKITEGYGSFLKGTKQNNLIIEELNFLPLICYEIIFTKFIQESTKNTNLIINISEDGWFGDSIGPRQHFSKAIFRAVENDTFLLRSTNKGTSAIINNKGQILKKLNSTETGHIEFKVPLLKSENKIKNDLIFFLLLITYIFIFNFYKNNYAKK